MIGNEVDLESADITRLLHDLRKGGEAANERLIAAVYKELRKLAASYLRKERPDHSLQPTALVHEAYLRLLRMFKMDWKDRSHFFAMAAKIMRRILVDTARRHQAEKHGHAYTIVGLDETVMGSPAPDALMLALNDALDHLALLDARQASIVEMRFFGGLSEAEIAEMLEISERTVKRDWRSAKAWLYRELAPRPAPGMQAGLPHGLNTHSGTRPSL